MKHILPLLFLFIACNKKLDQIKEIDVQGHRGCRGLMPENTIEGFIKAVELGVNTLELDVVISKDHQVVVSHEAFFNHEITSLPNAQDLNEANEKSFKDVYKRQITRIVNQTIFVKRNLNIINSSLFYFNHFSQI